MWRGSKSAHSSRYTTASLEVAVVAHISVFPTFDSECSAEETPQNAVVVSWKSARDHASWN